MRALGRFSYSQVVDVRVRLVDEDDAAPLAALLRLNRDFMTPWEPARMDRFFTDDYQRRLLAEQLVGYRDDRLLPLVIVEDSDVVGRITISHIVRGAFQSAHLGYWVTRTHNGRGVATAAVAATLRLAFGQLGLHRLQAATLLNNVASQRVLLANGFTSIGLAPRFIEINGHWQDHLLFQRIREGG
jgi:ribosomal-protein-alanine N-acetyltransferase